MRAYSSYSIDQLEALVEENQSNRSVLQGVKKELGHRSQKRRQRALLEVIERLCAAGSLRVELPAFWIDHLTLEKTLSTVFSSPISNHSNIHIFVPSGCSIMVSAAVQLLSFVNQLLALSCSVTIEFEAGWSGTMNYLKRINFFKQLDQTVSVMPVLRKGSRETQHQRKNVSVVEIEKLSLDSQDTSLPDRLAEGVVNEADLSPELKRRLKTAIETLFSELTSNVCLHSRSTLPAYAVCQRYSPDNNPIVHVSVCDSGVGILDTIRPALPIHYSEHPEYQKMPDEELILNMFLEGISSKGDNDGGSGLVSCATQAMKFKSTISIRTNNTLTLLKPCGKYYVIDTQPLPHNLIHMNGTYITFQIPLDHLT
ncbi:hypothetical protein FT643_09245 [Ketobacter sp. MCCC 1A13808]|uniref:hypothetical protein n=1 Tax=Ketobacter sp. MCCC 1A13808 TaxID=2602738 RepID=UPI0012EB8679|nr:hypothetical protein [Ketobacter sp. MCCC 1A13808]MVF12329.1 hypothetical protein [Ketobacter sp. MCCC 1A13808]